MKSARWEFRIAGKLVAVAPAGTTAAAAKRMARTVAAKFRKPVSASLTNPRARSAAARTKRRAYRATKRRTVGGRRATRALRAGKLPRARYHAAQSEIRYRARRAAANPGPMRVAFLPANQRWAWTWGGELLSPVDGELLSLWERRADLVKALARIGVTVAKNGVTSAKNPSRSSAARSVRATVRARTSRKERRSRSDVQAIHHIQRARSRSLGVGARFTLAIPVRAGGLDLPAGSRGTITDVHERGRRFVTFDDYPYHHPVPFSARWIKRANPRRRKRASRGGATSRAHKPARAKRRRNPAPFAPGERVSVPYTGRSSYFGRKVKKTREKGTVEGYAADGNVQVSVKRGRKLESHHFPAANVLRVGKHGPGSERDRLARTRQRIDRKTTRAQLRGAEKAAKAARSGYDCAEAQARQIVPQYGEPPSPQYRAARSRMSRLETEARAQDAIAFDLGRRLEADAVSFSPNPRCARRRRNPGPPRAQLAQARETFRMWHDFDPRDVVRVKGARTVPPVLVRLGEMPEIIYRSNKWEGKAVTYQHTTKRPRPILCCGPDGKGLFIVGGRTRVTERGLVD